MQASGKRYIIYPSRRNVIKIWNIADIHLGNRACDKKRLARDIKKVKEDPFSFWIGGGDYADYITPNDKRWDGNTVDSELLKVSDLGRIGEAMTEKVAALFTPIKNKCLGLVFGNHEDKYMSNENQQGLHHNLCASLGVPDLGYAAFLDVVFVRSLVEKNPTLLFDKSVATRGPCFSQRVFIHHGAGGATTPGGKINRLIKFMDSFEADIYMIGHVHDQLTIKRPILTTNEACEHIQERNRIGMISGAYIRTYTQDVAGYGEKKGYAPVPLGAVYVEVIPDKKEVYARI